MTLIRRITRLDDMPNEPDRLQVLRCADQDREMVAQLLNTAYADGRLTFDEHADHISAAYDAKTFGELNRLTTDLVPQQRPAPVAAAPVQQATVAPLPGAYQGGNAFLSTLKPGPISSVAEEITVNAWLGEVRLDLVGAAFASRDTTIRVGGLMCDIKIRVPEGVTVNLHGLSPIMADAKVDGTIDHADGVRINLVGTVIMGDVKVLGPGANPRKYEKFVR